MNRVMVGVVGVWVVAWALAGCQDTEHFPPGEGGGTGGGGGATRIDAAARPDAAVDAGELDTDGGLTGRLCSSADLRDPLASCQSGDLSGIRVAVLGSDETRVTDSAGNFALPVGFEEGLFLAIGGQDDDTRDSLVPAEMWDGSGVNAPRVSDGAWEILIGGLNATEQPDTATI